MGQRGKVFITLLIVLLCAGWLFLPPLINTLANAENREDIQSIAYNPNPPPIQLPTARTNPNILNYDFKNGSVPPKTIPCKLNTPLKNSRESALIWATYGMISSCFYNGGHTGLDIANTYDIPIIAAQEGVVYFVERVQGYGNQIKLQHPNGWQTHYAHLNSFVVKAGDYVRQGQLIGYMGNTGNSTGPHLHFELLINDQLVDPLPYLPGEP
jgi:murein DD-endopeptidase MepM/ murein hydrolase activator NlpD